MTSATMPFVEPDALGDPPASDTRARVRTGHADVVRLERDRDWPAVAAAAAALDDLTGHEDAAEPRLFEVRLAQVRGLLQLGRGREAHDVLAAAEAFHGSSWKSRALLSRLRSYLGDVAGALTAISQALMMLPLDAKPGKVYRELAVQRAEALTAAGRKTDARRFLVGTLAGQVPKFGELAALRRTIDSSEALEEFYTLLAPAFIYPGHRARTSLHHFSIAARDNGEPQLAIAAARQRFLAGLEIVTFGSKSPADRASWSLEAAAALRDLRHDLDAIGLEPFLVSGTLLGCVRDHDIIGHDKDIDLGVLTEMPAAALKSALGSTGRFGVKPLITDKLVQVQHANGVMLDVFLHWREGELVWHEGQKARWWNRDFGLVPAEFLGQEWAIPDDPETYLNENYGPGWRVPEPDFETFVDTPNMVIHDDDHITWYFFDRLHDYYHAGKLKQFRKVWAALEPRIGEDGAVRAAVARVMQEGEAAVQAMADAEAPEPVLEPAP